MPRKQKGGLVPGRAGTSYTNRSDLARQPSLPARVAQGQTYGQGQSQLAAQKMVPLAPPRLALPTAGAGSPAPAPGAPPSPPSLGPGGAPLFIPPGSLGDLHRPTERPNEPVTSGASLGPGPNNLPPSPQSATTSISDVLSKAAQATNSAVLQQMASRAQAAGQ